MHINIIDNIREVLNVEFAEILEAALQNKNIKQKDLAEVIGVNSKNISAYICGTSEPDFKTMMQICKVLNIDLLKIEISNENDGAVLFTKNNKERELLIFYRSLSVDSQNHIFGLINSINKNE